MKALGEGPSRSLLCDYESSDSLRFKCSSDTGRESLELGAAALFVANHHRRIANLTRLTDCLARVGPGDEFLQTVHT